MQRSAVNSSKKRKPILALSTSHDREKTFQASVIRLAQLCRWTTYHTYDSRRCSPGFPDLVMFREARLIFAELKTDKGVVSPDQRVWLEGLAHVPGIEVAVWRPADWDHIVETLR
jgi:hypothetical protein